MRPAIAVLAGLIFSGLSLFLYFVGFQPASRRPGDLFRLKSRIEGSHISPAPRSKGTIRFAYNPFLVPSSLYVEVMRRDRLLSRQLAKSGNYMEWYPVLSDLIVAEQYDRSVDIGVLNGVDAIRVLGQGRGYVVSRFQIGVFSIISRRGRTLENLSHRSIGLESGSGEFLVERGLTRAGIDPNSVEMNFHGPASLSNLLVRGKLDALGAMEGLPTLVMTNFPGFATITNLEINHYLVAESDLREKNPDLVKAILAAQIRCHSWLRINRKNLRQASEWARQRQYEHLSANVVVGISDYDRLASPRSIHLPSFVQMKQDGSRDQDEFKERFDFAVSRKIVPPNTSWAAISARLSCQLASEVLENPEDNNLGGRDYDVSPAQRGVQ